MARSKLPAYITQKTKPRFRRRKFAAQPEQEQNDHEDSNHDYKKTFSGTQHFGHRCGRFGLVVTGVAGLGATGGG